MDDCIFCKIVRGELPCHKIWENEKFLAFLSIYPNTKGFAVLTTKEHYQSYVLKLPEDVLKEFILAVREVAFLLDRSFDDVGRTGVFFEGFGVDHAHAKFFPMHGTKQDSWEAVNSSVQKYFERYEGYLSSHNGKRADDSELARLAEHIRSFN